MRTIDMNKRNQNIDVCKGILIILVVFGHSLQYGFGPDYLQSQAFYNDLVFRAIYAFHMPLFMLISGYYFFYSNKKDYSLILQTKLKSIGIPFFFYCTFEFILTMWLSPETINNAYTRYINYLRYNMWFLSSVLFNMIVIATISHAIGNNKRKLSTIILFLLFILSFIVPDDLLFSRNHTFMFGFFLLGYYLNTNGFQLSKNGKVKINKILVLSILFAFAVCYFRHDIFVYTTGVCIITDGVFNEKQLFVDILRIMIGIIGCFWMLSICSLFNRFDHFILKKLMHYGRISLGIYGFQTILYFLIKFIMEKYSINFPHYYYIPIIITLVVLLLSELILRLCARNKVTKLMFLGGR